MSTPSQARKKRETARGVRWAVLLAVLALSTVVGLLHQSGVAWRPPGVDALCPFGAIEAAFQLFTTGVMIRRIAWSSIVILGAVLLIALLFRRSFCGLVCPLGTLQEIFGRLGRRLRGGRRLELPGSLDRPARYLKYAVFAWFVGATWASGTLAVRPYDPWVAYHHLFSDELLIAYAGGTIILGISVIGSVLYDRFFCKYLCPMGAVLAALAPLGRFGIRRDADTCTDCGLCDKACPTNVAVSAVDAVVDAECIDCSECVTACPVPDCLRIETRSGARITPIMAIVSVVAIFALVIGIFTATGDFAWEVGKGGCGGESAGSTTGAGHDGDSSTGTVGDFAWIRGSTTFSEITQVYGVPQTVFTEIFAVPASEQDLTLSGTKDVYGFSPGEVRAFTEAYVLDSEGTLNGWPGTFADDCEEE